MLSKTNTLLGLLFGVSLASAQLDKLEVPPLQINTGGNETLPSPLVAPLYSASVDDLKANNLTRLETESPAGKITTFMYYYNMSNSAAIPNYWASGNGTRINTTFGFLKSDIMNAQEAKLRVYIRQGILELQQDITEATNVTGAPSDGLGKVPRGEVQHRNISVLVLPPAEDSTTLRLTVAGSDDSIRQLPRVIPDAPQVSANLELSVMVLVHSMATTLLQFFLGPTPRPYDYTGYVQAWVLLSSLRNMFEMARSSLIDGFQEPYEFPTEQDVGDMLVSLWAGTLGGSQGPLVYVDRAAALLDQGSGV